MNDRTVTSQEIAEDAADWFGRLETGEPSEAIRIEFVRWLTRSPVHIEEFLRVSALHHALSRELKTGSQWLAGVLAEAGAADRNVVRMEDFRPTSRFEQNEKAPRRRFLRRVAAVVLAAAALAALVSVTGFPGLPGRAERFTTAVGEQRRVVLADGSGVLLNTDTEVRVRMSRALRLVELVRGEAIFDVEKDPGRPLRVISGNVAVQAVGTRFVVYRQHQGTVVTVVEGKVLVSPAGRAIASSGPSPAGTPEESGRPSPAAAPGTAHRADGPVGLDAGQKLTVAADGTIAEPASADVEAATSWARGRLVFDSETLDTVVAELNRYNVGQMVIAEAALRDRRITGVFKIGDPDSFLALLSDLDDVNVERRADGSRLIRLARGQARGVDGATASPPAPVRQ
jgi:transmembrane sensor